MMKKWIAWILLAGILLGMVATIASAEGTDDYVFPEYGQEVALGEPILGTMNLTEYAEFVECVRRPGVLGFMMSQRVRHD